MKEKIFTHKHIIAHQHDISQGKRYKDNGYILPHEVKEYLEQEDCLLCGNISDIKTIEKMMELGEKPFTSAERVFPECHIRSLYCELVHYVDEVNGPYTETRDGYLYRYYRSGGVYSSNIKATKEAFEAHIGRLIQERDSKIPR